MATTSCTRPSQQPTNTLYAFQACPGSSITQVGWLVGFFFFFRMTMPSEREKHPGSSQFIKTLDFLPVSVSPSHRNFLHDAASQVQGTLWFESRSFQEAGLLTPRRTSWPPQQSRLDAVALLVLLPPSETVSTAFAVPAARFDGFMTLWNTGPRLVPETSIILAQPRVFTGSASVPLRGAQAAGVLRAAARGVAEMGQAIVVFGCWEGPTTSLGAHVTGDAPSQV